MIIFPEALLTKWRGISKDDLFNAVVDGKPRCFRYFEKLDYNWLMVIGGDKWHKNNCRNIGHYSQIYPKSIEEFFDSDPPYYFLKSDIADYEKEHPEVLGKPEPETPKEAVPPYLDGNNEHFAPELALAIRLWESIAKGEIVIDENKNTYSEELQGAAQTFLGKELPGLKIGNETKERFAIMISKKPGSLDKKRIEMVKGKFIPL